MIYFDNAATTLISSNALNAYENTSKKYFANPNSIHHLGMEVNSLLNNSRDDIKKELGLSNDYEVIFNSSATESNNLAIIGYCLKNINRGKHIITSKIEHLSVLEPFRELERNYGFKVDYVTFDEKGNIDIEKFKEILTSDTILVSLMAVNNETGLILPLDEIAKEVKKFPKCVLHVDACQALGKVKLNYNNFDMITISSHKLHGPKSIASLVKKKKINLKPILLGGGQEFSLRSSTQDYPLVVSFVTALHENLSNFQKNLAEVQLIYKFLMEELSKNDEIILNNFENNSPYILNFSLKNKKASVVVEALSNKEIYVSSVSACSSKKEEASYVLLELNRSLKEAKNSIRLSFSSSNTVEEAKIFINTLNEILKNLRG